MNLQEVTQREEKCVRMQSGQVHPSAIRSKKLIAHNLLRLMEEKKYSKITIKDITDSATLTRRTFYAHFNDKDEVLNYHLSSLTGELAEKIKALNTTDQRQLALLYFEFWMGHSDLLGLMRQHQLLPILLDNFESQITEIRDLFGCNLQNNAHVYMYYSSSIFTGVLWNILDKWIASGTQESPEELVNILAKITKKLALNLEDDKEKSR